MQENDVKKEAFEQENLEQEVKQETAENTETTEAAEEVEAKAEEETKADPKDEQITELQNRLLRLQADFDNYRRRTATEKEQLSAFVTADVVDKFLRVLDNFERAELSVASAKTMESVVSGMKQIRRQFDDCLKSLDVTEIPAQNEKFDPNLHEALMRGQNPDLEDDTIDMVLQKGYRLRDKVIRHSKVRVINND